jgi:hypothetical protein
MSLSNSSINWSLVTSMSTLLKISSELNQHEQVTKFFPMIIMVALKVAVKLMLLTKKPDQPPH